MSQELYVGWTPGLDIPAAVERVSRERLSMWTALITVIDSTPRVGRLPTLVPLLHELGSHFTEVEDSVAVGAETLLQLVHEHDLFCGFDEVWLLSEPPRMAKPSTLKLTSDIPLTAGPPEGLSDWMHTNRCLAGLGDGDGLNYATTSLVLADLWRN